MKALLGSIVQKGMFSAGTLRLDRKLKVLLLPILAIPRSPIFREVPGRPSLARFCTATANLVDQFSIIIIITISI